MPIAPGAPAPAATADLPPDVPVDLPGLWARGPALLFFFKADCPATELGARVLPRLARALPGLVVAAVSQDAEDEALAFAGASGWGPEVRVLLDPAPWAASDAYGVRATPTWVLVGAGGDVAAVAEGWSRDDANALAASAAALLGAPAPVIARADDPGPPFRPG